MKTKIECNDTNKDLEESITVLVRINNTLVKENNLGGQVDG